MVGWLIAWCYTPYCKKKTCIESKIFSGLAIINDNIYDIFAGVEKESIEGDDGLVQMYSDNGTLLFINNTEGIYFILGTLLFINY